MGTWQNNLEIVGAGFFLRYRKRLMLPGISLEIRRDLPGLSLADIMVRVHAGRRIVLAGDDFLALAAIRSGRWQGSTAPPDGASSWAGAARRDRLSRILVRFGGALFLGFCLLSVATASSAGLAIVLASALGLGLAVRPVWRRHRAIAEDIAQLAGFKP